MSSLTTPFNIMEVPANAIKQEEEKKSIQREMQEGRDMRTYVYV